MADLSQYDMDLINGDETLKAAYKTYLRRKLEYDALQFKGMRDQLKAHLNQSAEPEKQQALPVEDF